MSTYYTVPLGYNSVVELDNLGKVFCTSCSVTVSQQLINSSGSFGGEKNIGDDFWLNSPHRVDYADIQISVSFQILLSQLKTLLNWIKMRHQSHDITINGFVFQNSFWSSIGLSVGQNQLLTCSINFNSFMGYNEITKLNSSSNSSTLISSGMYQKTDSDVIPYYNTSVVGNSNWENSVSGWSLDLNQNLIKKSHLNATGGYKQSLPNKGQAYLPRYVLFGGLNGTLKVNTFCGHKDQNVFATSGAIESQNILNTGSNSKSISNNATLSISIIDNPNIIQCQYSTLQSVTPNISQQSSIQNLEYSYLIHGLKIN